MSDMLSKLDLAFNPFEPAASGPPVGIAISPPDPVAERLRNLVETSHHAPGPKVFVILGDYGTGKTCLLRWLHDRLLPDQRIKPFYFDNPGVHFYDLANMLLRTIGRKDFAKFIWEFAGPHLSKPYQRNLFRQGFEEYLTVQSRSRRGGRQDIVEPLQRAALVAEADYVISYDNYLMKMVKHLKTEEALCAARRRLESRTAAVLSREPGSITLPDALEIGSGGH